MLESKLTEIRKLNPQRVLKNLSSAWAAPPSYGPNQEMLKKMTGAAA